MSLNLGILKELFSNEKAWTAKAPATVQVTNVKPIPNDAGKRLRLLLSDGVYTVHAVIRPELVDYCESNGLQKTSIVTLQSYDIERMGNNNKHVIIIGKLTILKQAADKIGSSLVAIDDYFRNHPEEDIYTVASTNETTPTPANNTPAPAAPAKPPAAASTAQPAPATAAKPSNIYAIDQLSPYQNVWTIKARVSFKGDLRTWSNQRGEGKLFNVNFLDETDEIRATAFNEQADKFFNLLHEGKVYYVSKARIQPSRPQFSHLKHPYELQLDRDTTIEECLDTADVPTLKLDFTKLNNIQNLEADSIINVIGVVKEVGPAFQITSKAGRSYDRRDITIVDDSQFAVPLGLWNKAATDFNISEGSVVAVKGAKVSDFNGKTLSMTPGGSMMPNPDITEAWAIKGWYDEQGKSGNFQSLKTEFQPKKVSIEDRQTIEQIQSKEDSFDEKGEYFQAKASINFIKPDNFSYPACSTEGCNRKVIEQSDGTWRCEKCETNHPQPNHRYILTCSIVDPTGQLWLTIFDDQAKSLLGISANDLYTLKEEGSQQFNQILQQVQMTEFDFRFRGKPEHYNGQTRIRYNVTSLSPLDYNNETEYLAKQLSVVLN